MTNVLIFALDEEIADQARSAGIAYLLDTHFSRGNSSIGTFASESYNQAVYSKTRHQVSVLKAGFNLFFSDTDIPWTSDWSKEIAQWAGTTQDMASEEFNRYTQSLLVGLFLSWGAVVLIELRWGLLVVSQVLSPGWPWHDLNTGFFFARSTTATLRLFALLLDLEDHLAKGIIKPNDPGSYTYADDLEKSDQTCFNFLLVCGFSNGTIPATLTTERAKKYITMEERKHLRWPWHKKLDKWPNMMTFTTACSATTSLKLNYGVLRPDRFQTGHKKYSKTKWKRMSYEERHVMYHGNYLFGAEQKMDAFKDRGRWIESC
jgi:hypothetical protein